MKILEPRTIQEYLCEYCHHKPFLRKSACTAHEDKCFRNPKRNCPTCKNTGKIDEVMNNGHWGTQNKDCPHCETATTLGGKSYIYFTGDKTNL